MRRVVIAALGVLLLAGPAGCTDDPDRPGWTPVVDPRQTRVTLQLNWTPYGEHAPFYYGIEKGFYKAEGIKLEIKPGAGSARTIQAVGERQVDFGWADTPPLIKSVAAGAKVRSAGVFLQKGPASVEFFADAGITQPADLKGKIVGGTPGDALYATFPAWLKANGVAGTDVRIVDLEPAGKLAALSSGKVDAIMGFFHDQAPTIEANTNKKVQYLLYADWGFNLLGTGIVVNTEALAQDPELVSKFVRATQRAWREAASDPPGAVAAMAKLSQDEPAEDVLAKQFILAVSLLDLGAGPPGVNSEDRWTETITLLARHAGVARPGPPTAYWNGSFASSG